MEWAAVDTLVRLTKGNVDAARTSWKQLDKLWKIHRMGSRRHLG